MLMMLMELHVKLRNERERRNWTQKYLCTLIGINPTTYSNWEQGSRKPDLEALIKLADLYEITLDKLVGRDFNQHKQSVNVDLELLQFFSEVQAATNQKRDEIIRYWRYINQN